MSGQPFLVILACTMVRGLLKQSLAMDIGDLVWAIMAMGNIMVMAMDGDTTMEKERLMQNPKLIHIMVIMAMEVMHMVFQEVLLVFQDLLTMDLVSMDELEQASNEQEL